MSTAPSAARPVRVAVMQPYFFPYPGYFQLMHAVDWFVLYDDAQFMKGGWINRNRLLVDGRAGWWTYPVVRESHRLPIRERRYRRSPAQTDRLLAQVRNAYRRAPEFARIEPLLAPLIAADADGIADYNRLHLEALAAHLGLGCRFVASSAIPGTRAAAAGDAFDGDGRGSAAPAGAQVGGTARVLALCRALGATHYVNAPGGRGLYDAAQFADAGLRLEFVEPETVAYPQFGVPHVPGLSIVDALMFNGETAMRELLRRYRLDAPPVPAEPPGGAA